MWNANELGCATWHDERGKWLLDVRGGQQGIGIFAAPKDQGDAAAASDQGDPLTSLIPADPSHMPMIAEQYVRRDELHLHFPQGDGPFELKVVLKSLPLSADDDPASAPWLVEATVAIQTDLLDSHPTVDIVSRCRSIEMVTPCESQSGIAPITIAESPNQSASVLLGPHDQPFTTAHSDDQAMRLRLFGEFLEKGVIRKARPWFVFQNDGKQPNHSQLTLLWHRLRESPLPLRA